MRYLLSSYFDTKTCWYYFSNTVQPTSAFCIPEYKICPNLIIKSHVVADVKDTCSTLHCTKQGKKCKIGIFHLQLQFPENKIIFEFLICYQV